MFSVLTSKIFGGLSVALAAALLWLYVSTSATIASYDKAINEPVKGWSARLNAATADLATTRGNAAVLRSQIEQQNDAFQRLQTDAATRYANGQVIRSNASEAVASAAALTAKLSAAKAGADICASADQLILETVK